jgi:6-phosphogluconolactonase
MPSKKRMISVSGCSLALFAGALAASSSSALANPFQPPNVGHAYVNDNTTGVNTLAGFARHADGSLTPLPGSPFAIGGAGTGKGLGSQGALQLSSDGQYALAVDAASNQISVARLGFNGVPQPVSTVSSGGEDPVSIAVSGNLVYVANAGAGGTNVTGFYLDPFGHLYPLPGSTVPLPEGSDPGDVLFNSTGQKLVVTLIDSSQIASFDVRFDGRLTAAPGSPFPAQGLGPFGSEFRPTNPSQLFVSNAHNVGAGTGTVSAFNDSFSGELSSIGASPFADDQTAPCWIEISHDGRFLFTVNTGSGFISSYAISPNGTLTLLGSVSAGPAGTGAVDARLTPDGKTLLVNGSKADVVAAFAVNGGELTELPSSPTPLPVGAVASGIVAD